MQQQFSIKNFRCFADFNIAPLERINLISGKNNVGKTALLEALYIYTTLQPEALFQINAFRGFKLIPMQEPVTTYFFNFNTGQKICLTDSQAELVIEFSIVPSTVIIPAATEGKSLSWEILFSHTDLTLKKTTAYKALPGRNIDGSTEIQVMLPAMPFHPPVKFLPARERNSEAELATELSKLRLNKQLEPLIHSLQMVENRLIGLEILAQTIITGKQEAFIYGDIKLPQLLPLSLMGEGMRRLLEIALAIIGAAGGVVLIDEIENGFHYSISEKVWRAIADLARQFEVQIFATTHSWECIRGAHQAFTEAPPYDFRYHRLQQGKNGIEAVTLDQESLESVLEEGWEIR